MNPKFEYYYDTWKAALKAMSTIDKRVLIKTFSNVDAQRKGELVRTSPKQRKIVIYLPGQSSYGAGNLLRRFVQQFLTMNLDSKIAGI